MEHLQKGGLRETSVLVLQALVVEILFSQIVMGIHVSLPTGWNWILILSWSNVWETSLFFPLSFLRHFSLKTYHLTLLEQKLGHSTLCHNVKLQSLHRQPVCCMSTFHSALTSVCFSTPCGCCTVLHGHQSRTALPRSQLLHSALRAGWKLFL